jgi:hypothetical protein
MLAACNATLTEASVLLPTHTVQAASLDTATPTNTPSPTATPLPTGTAPNDTVSPTADISHPLVHVTRAVVPEVSDRGWLIFASDELGIRFEYPLPLGADTFNCYYFFTNWPEWEGDLAGTCVG